MGKMSLATGLAVCVGEGLGAVLRIPIEESLPTRTFPFISLAINISACFLLGAFIGLTTQPTRLPEPLRLGIGPGLLGGFAAYSSAMLAANRFLETDHWILMAAYLVGGVALGLLAIVLGFKLVAACRRPAVR